MRGYRQRLAECISSDLTCVLSLLVLGLIAYEHSFFASFYLDDARHILQNEAIVDLSNIGAIFSYSRQQFLPYLTLAINYKIGGLNHLSYHILNFFIHYGAAIFLYLLCLETWKTPVMQGAQLKFSKQLAAFMTAGIFLLHPLQTESVTYVIQRSESMAGMFYLATLYFYLRGRREGKHNMAFGYFLLAGVAAFCAAFSKATAVTLPVMIVIYELFFFKTSFKDIFGKKMILILLIPAGVVMSHVVKPLLMRGFFYDPGIAFTRKQYILTQFSVLLTYLRLYFWPANQNIDWDYPLASHFFTLETVASFLVLLMLILIAVLAYRRFRLVSLGIVGFFITLAPTSSVIPLHDVIFEHRMYLAVAFLAMGCVQIFLWSLARVGETSRAVQAVGLIVAIVALTVGLTSTTRGRNEVWTSSLSLWKDAVQKSPNKARPHNNYGRALYMLGMSMTEAAMKEFEIANQLMPQWEVPWHNLAIAYFEEGDYQRAIDSDLEAIKRKANYKPSLYKLGCSYKGLEQWDNARIYLERLVKLNPGYRYLAAYVDLVQVYQELGLHDKAMTLAGVMTKLPDGLPLVNFYRGMAFYRLNDFDRAKSYFTVETEQESGRTLSLFMLGQINYLKENYEQAAEMFRKALAEIPSSPEAHYNMAVILMQNERWQEALKHLAHAKAVDPFSLDISLQTITCYGYLGYLTERINLVGKLLGVRPGSEEFSFLQANKEQNLDRIMQGYADKFLGGTLSPGAERVLALIAALREDYGEALKWYERYAKNLENLKEKQRITREVLRLKSILQGKGPLRTPHRFCP
jgi:tetratricopeptide (TPR) repeat protein